MSRRTPSQPSTNSITPASGQRRATVRFVLIFALLTVVYYIVVLLPWVDGTVFPAYLRLNAEASNVILHCLGQTSRVENTTIRSPQFAITVRRGCDALEPAWLFAAAVLAFPASWRRKLEGLAAGVSVILLLNLIRIVSLYLFGTYTPRLFETMHLEVWPVCFILAALGLWLLWVRHQNSRSAAAHAAS